MKSVPAPFHVSVLDFTELKEIEGSWTTADFRQLLERMDFDDVDGLSEEEMREMCVMSLQSLEPAEAAAVLLQHRLGDALNKGQIQNASHEMLDEKLWEEYADMPLHERFFHVGSLLHQAFPRVTPVPDAVEVRLEIKASDPEGGRLLTPPQHESLLVRLLADGMPDAAPLNRMFGEAIRGKAFPEAESIVWIFNSDRLADGILRLRVIGSGYWLDALRATKTYSSMARPDAPAGE